MLAHQATSRDLELSSRCADIVGWISSRSPAVAKTPPLTVEPQHPFARYALLRDGVALCELLANLAAGSPVPRYCRNPRNPVQCLDNVAIFLAASQLLPGFSAPPAFLPADLVFLRPDSRVHAYLLALYSFGTSSPTLTLIPSTLPLIPSTLASSASQLPPRPPRAPSSAALSAPASSVSTPPLRPPRVNLALVDPPPDPPFHLISTPPTSSSTPPLNSHVAPVCSPGDWPSDCSLPALPPRIQRLVSPCPGEPEDSCLDPPHLEPAVSTRGSGSLHSHQQLHREAEETTRRAEEEVDLCYEEPDPFQLTASDVELLAEYEIKGVVGEGAFSIVHRVIERASGAEFALKILDKSLSNAWDSLQLEREISLMREMRHPNLVRYVRHFETDTKALVIMELLRGGELQYCLKMEEMAGQPAYTEAEARLVMRQVLSVLAHLHEQGIVHRDLKPENVVFKKPGCCQSIKLIDFGLAKQLPPGDDCRLTEQVGSIEYQAPDIFSPQGYDAKVDIFAAGVLTYMLLGGYLPWYDPNPLRVRLRISRADYEFHPAHWHAISEPAQAFCRRLLSLDPVARPTAADALSDPWLHSP